MHKKYTKLKHTEHHHNSRNRRDHLKSKETDDSTLEVIKAPQNSRNELNKKLEFEDHEVKEKFKQNIEKYKHKREESKSNDRNSKTKHEKIVQDLEPVKHKEKREKRDKERLNKIEKYLEGLNKDSSKKPLRNRPLSLDSSKAFLKSPEKYIRSEKTFHGKASRDVSTNSHLTVLNHQQPPPITKEKSHQHKKHKHKERKNRDSSKEQYTKDNQQSVVYCEVELQSPFLQNRKYLYPKASIEKSSRKRSSSIDNSALSQLELNQRDKIKHLKDKETASVKLSTRRSKLKIDLTDHKDQKSNVTLGPYRKYFAFDKPAQHEKETTRRKKKKRQKGDSTTKLSRNQKRNKLKEEDIKPEKAKKDHEKTSPNNLYKEKIEDDIKGYFSKIQNLIDKKLDFFLGNSSNSKQSKSNLLENENDTGKTRGNKEKKAESHDQYRSKKQRKKIERSRIVEEEKQEKRLVEEAKARHPVEENKKTRKSRPLKNTEISNISLKRERYPSEDSKSCRWHQISHQQTCQDYRSVSPPRAKRGSDKEVKEHKRHINPYTRCSTHEMSPHRLINMLEHPSTFSVQSNTSLLKRKVDEVNHRQNDIQTGPKETENYQKRDRSLSKKNTGPNEGDLNIEDLDKTLAPEVYSMKPKKRVPESKTNLVKEKLVNVSKCRPSNTLSEFNGNGHHYKRSRSSDRKRAIPGEDDFDEMGLLEVHNKKIKKDKRQSMNLECKTISIVGIPSQIRESTIFNETQTTTSLNVINLTEDIMEQKKKSKRFKLYYKYSVADNKCPNESDKSSEGKKSVVSDSYKVVSDPSDHSIEVWEDKDETFKEVNNSDLAKVLFIMKKEKVHKNRGEKYRKRGNSPKSVTLNNIVEEPSNISIAIRTKENIPLLKKDLNCTYFKTLKSSSSGCNLELIKKSTQNDANKHKNRNPLKDNSNRPKSYPKKNSEGDRPEDKKSKYEEKRVYNKKMALNKNKKKHRDMNNYTSKSDIDISYDSLRKYKFCKDKQNLDGPSYFREQLRQILPDMLFRKSSPERKSIDRIIKEEIREIIREIPKRVIREISFGEEPDVEIKDLHKPNLKESNGTCNNQDDKEKIYYPEKTRISHETDTNEKFKIQDVEEPAHPCKEITDSHETNLKESYDNLEMQSIEEITNNSKLLCESPKTPDVEDKTYCSKKIGTYHATSKIPSLIKGYTGMMASQITRDDSTEIHNSTDQSTQNEASENVTGELDENNLVDAATEISITQELAEKTMIMLENKKSQTPSYLDTPTVVTICDAPKQYRHSKKVATMNNIKCCQIVDPFANTKIGSVCKSTRPIINLENSQFPTHKLPRPVSPVAGQYTRQKSNLSEEKCVKFENQEKFGPRKFLERRPATAGDQHNRSSPMDTFTRKATKPALTISTNIVTIDTSVCTEKYKTYDTQSKWSRRDINENTDQQETMMDRYDVTTHHIQRNLVSKSSISLNDGDVESKIGSLVCVDKYSNIQKINLNSNSNSRSLDRYTTKSLLNDNPHTSRLFLTKSFDPKMNTYQRRKMYDETIRRKMKKKYGTPSQMGPRIFEVRYLTLENPNLDEGFDAKNSPTPVVNQKCISRLPTYNTKNNKAKQRSKTYKPSIKKSRKTFPKNKEDACKFSGRDIFAPVISDVDQLNKFRRKTFPNKKVEEIFMKDIFSKQEKSRYKEQNASVTLKNEASEEHVTNKTESADTSENFKNIIDHLYNSIISYCDTRFKLPQSPPRNSIEIVKDEQNVSKSPHINEKSYIVFPKPSNESVSTSNDPYKESSCSERNFISEEKEWKHPANLICTHLSCPVLAGSSSSFDYLYEDGPIELNKDAVLLHFKKPMKTILGYALNNTNRIQRETFRNFHKEEYRTSNSVTESEESGYSSSNSKKCASVSSFFRKPSIVNLFKPVKKLEISLQSTSSLDIPKSGPNLQEYNVMNQKCIEYAEKVRNQSQNKNKSEETFQEIPLDVLLLCKKSSAYFSDFNSNCSLCKKHSNSDLPDITEADELSNNTDDHLTEDGNIIEDNNVTDQDKNTEALLEGNVHEETSFLYKDMDRKPCVDIITLQKSQTSITINDTSQLIKEIMQSPVVLSLTNLNSCSLTVIEEPNDNNTDFCFEGMQKESVKSISLDVANLGHKHSKENCHSNSCASKSPSYVDIDGKSDISSGWGCRYANSSSVATRFMAKKFFDSLLKVYEKEIEVTNKLFQDNDFFLNVLLESVKSGELPKSKNFKWKKLLKDKVKNIGNMFHPKNCTAKSGVCVDVLGTYNSSNNHQRKLQILAGDARKYFSMFVQAVKTNKDINDEIKICGLLKLLERIEDGDFAILRKKEEVDFEQEIREQVKEAFVNIHQLSAKEARKHKRSLTTDDLELIRTFVSKYRIGLLSKTDLIATYIGRGVFKTEGHLKAAVNYLIQQNKTNDIDLKDFDEHCKILRKC